MINWTAIYEVLQEWCNKQARPDIGEIRTVWKHKANEYKHTVENHHLFVVLLVNGVRKVGIDEVRYENKAIPTAGKDLVATVVGNRVISVNVTVHSRDQRPQNNALIYSSQLQTSLGKPSVLAAFRAINISYARTLPSAVVDEEFQDRMESLDSFAVEFNVAVCETDQREEGGAIETVLLTSDVLDEGGTSLPSTINVTDKEISR